MRVVIDTNALISGIFWSGKPKILLNKARRGEITSVTSEVLLSELKDILTGEDKPFHLTASEADRIVSSVRVISDVILPISKVSVCRDEDDNRVIECALDGNAKYIVTGDFDLLALREYQGIAILSVADFLKVINTEG
ncbi:MAG: putative toxin-antitoxin system toxin component, PIN family [Candidatus Dadabacteria bacterium]